MILLTGVFACDPQNPETNTPYEPESPAFYSYSGSNAASPIITDKTKTNKKKAASSPKAGQPFD